MVKRKRQVERCVSLMRIAILDNDLRFSDQLYQKISMGFAKRDWALFKEVVQRVSLLRKPLK